MFETALDNDDPNASLRFARANRMISNVTKSVETLLFQTIHSLFSITVISAVLLLCEKPLVRNSFPFFFAGKSSSFFFFSFSHSRVNLSAIPLENVGETHFLFNRGVLAMDHLDPSLSLFLRLSLSLLLSLSSLHLDVISISSSSSSSSSLFVSPLMFSPSVHRVFKPVKFE